MYELNAVLGQPSGKRGERVTLRAEYANVPEGTTLSQSVVRIAEYGIFGTMTRETDRAFAWTYTIPWEAPVRTYNVDVYAVDSLGNRGAVQTLQFAVTG